jgi:hypothetical protein
MCMNQLKILKYNKRMKFFPFKTLFIKFLYNYAKFNVNRKEII